MLTLDMSDTVECFAQPTRLFRQAPGTFSGGYFTPGPETELCINAVIEPGTGRDQALVPENTDVRDMIRIWTADCILGIDPGTNRPADQVEYAGLRYEVQTVMQWDGLGSYTKVMALKKEPRT